MQTDITASMFLPDSSFVSDCPCFIIFSYLLIQLISEDIISLCCYWPAASSEHDHLTQRHIENFVEGNIQPDAYMIGGLYIHSSEIDVTIAVIDDSCGIFRTVHSFKLRLGLQQKTD